MTKKIYLDYQATTPVDPTIIEKMLPFFSENFGNPHSNNHQYGKFANDAVEDAREAVANLINAEKEEIIFTSGATESNNFAIKSIAKNYFDKDFQIITVKTEHKCVLESCHSLEKEKLEVHYLDVNEDGLINLNELEALLKNKPALVTIMHVNNEIGVIQPLEEIGKLCKKYNAVFHSDAAQSLGCLEVDVKKFNLKALSISAHKIYGPKGIGALYVGRKPRIRLQALIHGGGHERGMRSGTLATHQIVGMGEAANIAMEEMDSERDRLISLRERLWSGVKDLEAVQINGDFDQRLPGVLNISFSFVEGESLIMSLKDLAISSGSACTSASLEPSYVLRALGLSDELAHSSLRFSFGRFTTEEDVNLAIEQLVHSVEKLRDLSPLWDMYKDGIDLDSVEWAAH